MRAFVAVVLTVPVAGFACPCARGLASLQSCCCDTVSGPDLVSAAGDEIGAPCCCRTEVAARSAVAAVVDSPSNAPRAAPGVLIPIACASGPSADDPIARVARAWLRPPARAPVYVEILHFLI
jgi:hypothetical protein